MKILNEQKDDLSDELMMSFAIMMECVWSAEVIAYKMADTMDAIGAKKTFIQERKMHFRKARQMMEGFIKHLEVSFDDIFNDCGSKSSGYMDEIQECANDIIKLLLIYYARGDGDWDRKTKMKQALLNFKPKDGVDLDGLLKYFKLQ